MYRIDSVSFILVFRLNSVYQVWFTCSNIHNLAENPVDASCSVACQVPFQRTISGLASQCMTLTIIFLSCPFHPFILKLHLSLGNKLVFHNSSFVLLASDIRLDLLCSSLYSNLQTIVLTLDSNRLDIVSSHFYTGISTLQFQLQTPRF